tara:strand:- start:209 stop:337 length:129 start_codon:yes stop_codon:yes gene_type:complete
MDSFLFIRPSGITNNAAGFEQMISGNIVQEKAKITKITDSNF